MKWRGLLSYTLNLHFCGDFSLNIALEFGLYNNNNYAYDQPDE